MGFPNPAQGLHLFHHSHKLLTAWTNPQMLHLNYPAPLCSSMLRLLLFPLGSPLSLLAAKPTDLQGGDRALQSCNTDPEKAASSKWNEDNLSVTHSTQKWFLI